MVSNATNPTVSETNFYDTGYTSQCSDSCSLWDFIRPDIFAVIVVFSVVLIIVIICAIYVLFLWKCPDKCSSKNIEKLDSTPFASTDALLEARTEPAGYFAVDHHMDHVEE